MALSRLKPFAHVALIVTMLCLTASARETQAATTPEDSNDSHDDKNSPHPLSRWTVYWCFIAMALNAATQSSGADEFPPFAIRSMARLSPLICLADMLVACITLVYGYLNDLGFFASAALYVHNSRRTGSRRDISLFSARTLVDMVPFGTGFLCGIKVLASHDDSARRTIWASLFFAAPIVHAFMRICAEPVSARDRATYYVRNGDGEGLLQVADVLWCVAYIIQFLLWIQTFRDVADTPTFSSGGNAKWTDLFVGSVIAAACGVSYLTQGRLFGYWSIGHWKGTRAGWRTCGIGLTMVTLAAGFPDDAKSLARWRHNVLLPLGTLAIVVLELWVVTLILDSVEWIARHVRAIGSGAPVPPWAERAYEAPADLELRSNPLLSTAPDYWRVTLMVTFGLCQLTFVTLNYALLVDSNVISAPKWADGLG